MRSDSDMRLQGGALRPAITPGSIRVGGLMTVKLGRRSLPLVQAMAVGSVLEIVG